MAAPKEDSLNAAISSVMLEQESIFFIVRRAKN